MHFNSICFGGLLNCKWKLYTTFDKQTNCSIWTQKDIQWDVASVLLYYIIATMWNIFCRYK